MGKLIVYCLMDFIFTLIDYLLDSDFAHKHYGCFIGFDDCEHLGVLFLFFMIII